MRNLSIMLVLLTSPPPRPAQDLMPSALRALAHDYYKWRDDSYPVATSSAGDHRLDERLADYTMAEVLKRRQHVGDLLRQVAAMNTEGWSKDDRVDQILFRAQLAGADFFGRRLDPEQQDPQLYINECSNGIFSLLQKEYAPRRTRALAATARMEQMPALLRTARANLTQPVKLYAQLAIPAARGGDDLYTGSLAPITTELSSAERKRFTAAREAALRALHEYADWLEAGLGAMPGWKPMGEAVYNELLKQVSRLPHDSIVFLTRYFEDGSGRARGVEVAADVSKASAVPVAIPGVISAPPTPS